MTQNTILLVIQILLLKAMNTNLNLWKVSKKTNVVNNNTDILLRFKDKMCPTVHIFTATFSCLSNSSMKFPFNLIFYIWVNASCKKFQLKKKT